jgi:chromosome segregation ATPase
MVDEYIALQNEEEELDRKIGEAETERADYQSRLNKAIDQKAKLMEEKEKVKAEKQRLQSSLDANEALEFGYEAGRRSMENKRARRE